MKLKIIFFLIPKRDILENNKKAEDSKQVFWSWGSSSPYSQAQEVYFPLKRQISWHPPLFMEHAFVPCWFLELKILMSYTSVPSFWARISGVGSPMVLALEIKNSSN